MTLQADAGVAAPSRAAQPRQGFRADIQGLRAFAVVVVILDHLFHWPSGGFVGVDVFFVISGYLITSHILRELDRTGRLSLSGFYRRRIRRIAPAATVTIVVTVAISALVLPYGRAMSIAVDGVWAFFFGANWRSMAVGTDYFQLGQLPSPLQHYWSLSVEEQFYFVWPLLTMVVFVYAIRRWHAARIARVAVTAVFAILVVASFGWAMVETATNPTAAYFSTFTRAWELGVGALLAAVSLGRWSIPFAFRVVLAWLGVAGLIASVFLIDATSPFPAPTAALPVLSTAAVIAAGIGIGGRTYDRALWPITNRVSTYVGAVSYSLYLWHFPVIVLLAAFVPLESRRYYVLALAITAVVSVLSYHFVEEPVRRSTWLLPKAPGAKPDRRGPIVAAVAVMALVAVAGLGAARLATPPPAASTPPPSAGACFGAEAAPGADVTCSVDEGVTADDVAPTLDQLPDDTAGGYSCWRQKGGPLKTCTFGSEEPDAMKVALVGDSHAAAMLPAFLDRAEALDWSLDTYTGFGCQWRDQSDGSDCDAVADEIQQRLVDGDYDLVITTAARWAIADASPESFSTRWAEVASTGAEVVVVSAVPTVPETAFACLSRVGADLSECTTSRSEATQPTDVQLEAAAQAGVDVVDMTDFYCTETECPMVIGDVIVYRDAAGHISGTYMKTMAPYLIERIEAVTG
ncbi:acyltransferase [Agromyces endophyticus]|uniref:acyltransferase family protein n=1 Tax=Agromyces sp. H17E-10 TaxID=2932244 RepID=UPI001FD46261|nr:acyltransferase family protein [Agromyces sp. H17E-10]UOQ89818.1 acyltransferase [Agromyces sp. H17E-10]